MDRLPQHQCFFYAGSPSEHLAPVVATILQKLSENYRCIYLNSPSMVLSTCSALAVAGVDVLRELKMGSLVLSSSQNHLSDGEFDIERMMAGLEEALQQALSDGYAGLWASGDMSWEFGPQQDFAKLLEYEWRLERFFRQNPQMSGVCQYHADTLPEQALRHGMVSHPALFVNETLSHLNPHYMRPEHFSEDEVGKPDIELAIALLLQPHLA